MGGRRTSGLGVTPLHIWGRLRRRFTVIFLMVGRLPLNLRLEVLRAERFHLGLVFLKLRW